MSHYIGHRGSKCPDSLKIAYSSHCCEEIEQSRNEQDHLLVIETIRGKSSTKPDSTRCRMEEAFTRCVVEPRGKGDLPETAELMV